MRFKILTVLTKWKRYTETNTDHSLIFYMLKFMERVSARKFFAIIIIMALQPFVGPWPLFHFLILYTIGRTPWTGYQPLAKALSTHRTTQTQNKYTQYRHPCFEWNSNPRSQRSSERRRSCLRPRSHCDRQNHLLW
jgi:hypothetical protein